MVSGAFEPEVSPDETQLAFVSYSARGYDLARIPFQPESWTRETGPSRQALIRPPPAAAPPEELYPVRPYDPLPTLRPHYWLPYVYTDGAGSTVGALTSGADVVGRHEYLGAAWWSLNGRMPGWALSYTNHTLYPDVGLYASRDLVVPAGLPYNTERQVSAGAFVQFPFTAFEQSFSLGASYQRAHLARNQDPFGLAPPDGLIAAAQVSAAYSDAKRFVLSVSPEQGQRASVALRVAEPALGSDFSFRQLTGSVSKYLALPFTWEGRPLHHVLAARLSGGIAKGDLARRHLFELGGFDAGDPVQAILNPANAPVRILRGFRAGSFYGEAYALATLEYRFHIVSIETGAWTLPFYARRLAGALFSDVGDAWNPFDEKGPSRKLLPSKFALHAGAGAELRLEMILGYFLPTDVRVGCARGLEQSSLAILDCYAALGGVF